MKKSAEQFVETVKKYKAIAIYVPGSPDPDAIASAYAIKLILKHLSINADIFAERKLSLSQNQAFLERLKIPVVFDKNINLKKYQAYIVPDFQNNRVEYIGEKIPCAVHIDHHEKSNGNVKADYSLINTDAGSTSTLVALIMKNMDITFSEEEMRAVATALTFGIQTDTDRYNNITFLDLEALIFLSKFTDSSILEGISSTPLPPETFQYYKMAKENEVIYSDWAFYGIGYIDAENRDSIALAADMILEKSAYNTVAVFAIIENQQKGEMYLDVSFRSKRRALDLNRIIKKITPNGGGRSYKGAYQIDLDYFLNAPDKQLLWKVVEATTLETLRRSRDNLHEKRIRKVYDDLRRRMLTFFDKESK
ncbi:MAG: DHH family phosphoesterase [Bacillota bacterium]